jgi:hypothetical protein
MSESDKGKPECRFCALLQSSIWEGQEYFRCQAERFDDAYGNQAFVWRGVWRPNKKVAAAQMDCPCFKVHPRVKRINRKGRQ